MTRQISLQIRLAQFTDHLKKAKKIMDSWN